MQIERLTTFQAAAGGHIHTVTYPGAAEMKLQQNKMTSSLQYYESFRNIRSKMMYLKEHTQLHSITKMSDATLRAKDMEHILHNFN